jgi:cold shock CspA family protein
MRTRSRFSGLEGLEKGRRVEFELENSGTGRPCAVNLRLA